MDILGIGPMELLLILIVALMVFGPDRLPTIGSKLGRAMRDMRRATRAISEEINATREAIEAPAKEIAEPFQEVAGAAKSMGSIAAAARNPGEAIRQSVLKELNAPANTEQTPAAPAEPDKTIAPPELIQETIPEADAAPLSADEEASPAVAEPAGAAPSGVPDLPAASDLQTEADSLAAADSQTETDLHDVPDKAPDATSTGDAPEEEPHEILRPGDEEAPPQSTDDSPPIMEP